MSGPDAFPPGGVRALLETGFVTEPTRRALQAKLDVRYGEPRFFTAHEHRTLQAVCDRLIPQGPGRVVDIAGALDMRLADDMRDGWRYDVLPPDQDAYQRGLQGFDQTAYALFGSGFSNLAGSEQEEVLRALAELRPIGPVWAELSVEHWFEGLLVEVAEIYFAHPLAQEAMGYLGMADAEGWAATGLDEQESALSVPTNAAA